MAFKIQDIKGALRLGGARPTLFQVILNSKISTELGAQSPFLVQASSLPGSTISPIEVSYWGRKIKVAGDRTFDNWQVTVMNDEDFKIRHILETWHNRINSLTDNLQSTSASPESYKETAQVHQYSKTGSPTGSADPASASSRIRSYEFVGLFPVAIGPIELSWEDNNRIETFQVDFSYDYYTISGGPGTIS
jgi:hypothetical protein